MQILKKVKISIYEESTEQEIAVCCKTQEKAVSIIERYKREFAEKWDVPTESNDEWRVRDTEGRTLYFHNDFRGAYLKFSANIYDEYLLDKGDEIIYPAENVLTLNDDDSICGVNSSPVIQMANDKGCFVALRDIIDLTTGMVLDYCPRESFGPAPQNVKEEYERIRDSIYDIK